MIYELKYGNGFIASSSGNKKQQIYGGKLSLAVNAAGTLTFDLPFGHDSYAVPEVAGDIITVLRDGTEIWWGHISKKEITVQRTERYTAEGLLAMLDDVTITLTTARTIHLYEIINAASMMTGYTWQSSLSFSFSGKAGVNKATELLSEYIKTNGGYFYVTRSGSYMRLNFTAGALKNSDQEVTDTTNIIDVSITEVRTGIHSTERAFTLKAFDLSYMDSGVSPFELLDNVHIFSEIFGIDDYQMISSIEIDLSNPASNVISVGNRMKTLTEQV